ncbi:GEVED domain-containing protein [Loktanella sp. Alg231-35]|uniref:GEVED domain-containing protein n=1 Tax=Loktanella sp. Alg231-35 TaxID=1922220 RepID=UPI000D552F1D|nr:GEVED domain-containing protein [Loktanella sp. Alg231-35]
MGAPTTAYAASPLCSSASDTATIEWVTRVGIGGNDIAVAPNTNYLDGSDASISTVNAGATFDIEVDVITSGSTFNEFVILWLDLNQDGVIDDATERVFTQNADVDGTGLTFSGASTAIPATAFNGTSYGRMIMQFAGSPNLCGSYGFGTTVDFRVDITGGAENPNAPLPPASVVATAGNGDGSLTITPPLTGNTPIEYLVTIQPDGTQITVPASAIGGPIAIPGLTNEQTYTFDVTSVFDFTNAGGDTVPLSSSSSTTSNAVTPDGIAPCLDPLKLCQSWLSFGDWIDGTETVLG